MDGQMETIVRVRDSQQNKDAQILGGPVISIPKEWKTQMDWYGQHGAQMVLHWLVSKMKLKKVNGRSEKVTTLLKLTVVFVEKLKVCRKLMAYYF